LGGGEGYKGKSKTSTEIGKRKKKRNLLKKEGGIRKVKTSARRGGTNSARKGNSLRDQLGKGFERELKHGDRTQSGGTRPGTGPTPWGTPRRKGGIRKKVCRTTKIRFLLIKAFPGGRFL